MRNVRLTTIASLVWMFLCTMLPTNVVAQGIEEVIVTAQKREESLQEVPISVTAFDGAAVRDLRLEAPVDLARHTPGLNVVGQFGTIFSIRGVGLNDFSPNNNPGTSVYIDQVLVPFHPMMDFQLFDLERVEILKGPQGTLYGRNNTGGAVNLISRRPSKDLEAFVDFDYGSYNTFEFEGAVGGPLTESLAGRFAFTTTQRNKGHQRNRVTGNHHGEADRIAGRVQLLWEPTADIEVLFNLHGGTEDSETAMHDHGPFVDRVTGAAPCASKVAGIHDPVNCVDFFGYSDADNDPFTSDHDFAFGGMKERSTWGASLAIDWDFPRFTATSITGFERYTTLYNTDNDAGPATSVDVLNNEEASAWSQEIRVTSDDSWPVNWMAGFYYTDDQFNGQQLVNAMQFFPLFDIFNTVFQQDSESVSVFARLEWPFAEQWTLFGGVRYTDESKDYTGGSQALNSFGTSLFALFFPPPAPFQLTSIEDDISDDDVTGEVGVNWTPNDDWLLYAKWSKGFKSGGYTGSFTSDPSQLAPFDAETLYAVETGFKSTLLNGTLQLNSAFYYYDYEDFQAFTFELRAGVPVAILANVGDIEVFGLEAEAVWRPIEGLDIAAGLNWNDAEVVQAMPGGGTAEGNEPSYTPEFTFNGIVGYTYPTEVFGFDVFGQVDFSWQDDIFFTIQNDTIFVQDDYWLVDLRVGVRTPDEKAEVAFWAENLANEEYLVNIFDSTNGNADLRTFGFPRAVGVSFRYFWE